MTVKVINRPETAREVCLSVLKANNVVYAVLVLILTAAGVWLFFSPEDGFNAVGVGFIISALVVLPVMQVWKVRRYIKQLTYAISQSCKQTPEQHIIFDERIVSERRVGDEIAGKTVIEYSAIRRAWETKNLILIHSRTNQILVLPKCDLTETEQVGVKRLLLTVAVPCRFKKAK